MDAEAGRQVGDGRYAVTHVLGRGMQGATLEAIDKRDGSLVAIKRFEIQGARSWKDVELAEREVSVLATLDHPLLPRHVDHFEEDGAIYLVMERIEGETVAELRRQSLHEEDVVAFLRDAADVLDYLHARRPPLIHRDIKPGNVIRRPDGRFAFVDFGSVRDTLKPEGGSTVVGTFGYMAPEQFQGRALPASDVYAVGATALAMLTGREPEDLPHHGLAIDVDAALRGIVRSAMIRALEAMLVPNPDLRSASLRPLLADLEGNAPARRRDRRRSRHRHRHQSPPAAPFVRAVLLFGLVVAQLFTFAVLRVAVPMVLSLLSIVLGSGLARAAANVSRAGERTGARLARAMVWTLGRAPIETEGEVVEEQTARRRVEASTDPRIRVAVGGQGDGEESAGTEEPGTGIRARR